MRDPIHFCPALAGAALVAGSALAGPLQPPSGPPGDTGPTTIVELPFTIDQSGSYRLLGDLTATGVIDGVTINADYVTLDLNGHTLSAGASGDSAIAIVGARFGTIIRDGTITGWNEAILGLGAETVVLENLLIENIEGDAVALAADLTMRNCMISNCSGQGVVVGDGALLENVHVTDCDLSGLFAGNNCTLINSSVRASGFENLPAGIPAIRLGDNSLAVGAGASQNTATGIIAGDGSLLNECISSLNAPSTTRGAQDGFDGFVIGKGSLLAHCLADENEDDGFVVGLASNIVSCQSARNMGNGFGSDGNDVDGDPVMLDVLLRDCEARDNSLSGFVLRERALAIECVARRNDLHGFVTRADSYIRDCAVYRNMDVGIESLGDGSWIDGLKSFSNGTAGVRINGDLNLLTRSDFAFDGFTVVPLEHANRIGPVADLTSLWSNFDD